MSRKFGKIFLFHAVFSDFRGILWGTMDVLIVARTKCRACRARFLRDILYARLLVRARFSTNKVRENNYVLVTT